MSDAISFMSPGRPGRRHSDVHFWAISRRYQRRFATHEKHVIEVALRESKGRVSGPFGAAARLGVPSSTLESKIRARKIDKRHFQSA
jgi:DNA-binding NtrC family response regulator